MTKLSLVIPTLNAGEDFVTLLQRIRDQSVQSSIEILIVDSGSSDGTIEIAQKFGARVISIEPQSFNHGGTRNLGISNTAGEFICLLTQDALPIGPRFFETLLCSLQDHQAAGVYARQIPRAKASPLVKRDVQNWISGSVQRRVNHIQSLSQYCRLNPMDRYLTCVFDNVASMIRREVWEKIPFPETPFAEDLEWAFRALCNGYTIVYEPSAEVEHSHERSAEYVFKRTYVDHYRLNELFGLRTIPSPAHAVRSFSITLLQDLRFLLMNPTLDARWWKSLYNIPSFAWAGAWGQYRGAQAASLGRPIFQSRDV